jgi:outer membrane protein OmpA-like peptidoglycan-associated protein
MRSTPILSALLALATPALAPPALAQVTIDLRALDPLRLPGQPAPEQPRPRPRVAPPQPATQASPTATQAPVTPAPLPETSVSLPIVTPPAAASTQAPTPIIATGPTDLRVAFDAAQTDLSAPDRERVKRFAATAPSADSVSFNVLAYAAGKADDPSVARRLSLSRALAVRAVLMAEGVASSRILVRALGAQSGGAPPDRVDIAILGVNALSPSAR